MDVQRSLTPQRGGRTTHLPWLGCFVLLGLLLTTVSLPAAAAPLAQTGRVTLSLSASPTTVTAGQEINFVVTVANGTSAQIEVNTLNLTFGSLPAGGVVIERPSGGSFTCDPPDTSSLSCQNATVAAGAGATLGVLVHTSAGVGGNLGGNANITYTSGGQSAGVGASTNATINASGPTATSTTAAAATNTTAPTQPTNTAAPAQATDTAAPAPPAASTNTPGTARPPAPTDTPFVVQPPAPTNQSVAQPNQRSRDREEPENTATPTGPTTQPVNGRITGTVLRNGAAAAGVTVELHQKAGGDTLLATAFTDGSGQYRFANLPSPTAGGYYYVYYNGTATAGDLDSWFTPDLGYFAGREVIAPAFNVADLTLGNGLPPIVNGKVALSFNPRAADESYIVRVAIWKTLNNFILSSPTFTGGSYTLDVSGFSQNAYHAIVQIISPSGNGFAKQHFRFTVLQTGGPGPINTLVAGGNGVVTLQLTANKSRAVAGEVVIYTLIATNVGNGAATNLNINVPLSQGQNLDIFNTKTTLGSLTVSGNTIKVQIASLPAGQSATITFYAAVSITDGVLNTFGEIGYNQAANPFRSNEAVLAIGNATVISGGGGPGAATATPKPGATATPKPRPTVKPPVTGGGSGGSTPGGGLPTTGGEFPLWVLLVVGLGLAGLLGARTLRLRRNDSKARL